MTDPTHRRSLMTRFRTYFLTGFVILAPLIITLYLAWSFVNWADSWVKPYLPQSWNPDTYLPFALPGCGLIVAVLVITIIGFLTANIIGRTIVAMSERALERMPLVRGVYKALKQIFQTFASNKEGMFKKVGLLEYPRKDLWSLVFIGGDIKSEVSALLDDKYETVPVFLPCTPNPTTGYLVYVPKSEIIPLSMSVEDAAKLLISVGMVAPEYHARTKALADAARADIKKLTRAQ